MGVTIYHNPRCSKSRGTLELLQDQGFDPRIIEYLKSPPTSDELQSICAALDVSPKELIRTGESRFSELGLSLDDDRSGAEWCKILSENPILIERPIVRAGDRAAIGRPPENVLKILP
jgi:arsenate reductase